MNKIESPITQGCFVPRLSEQAQWLLSFSMYFCYLIIISHFKRARPFIQKKSSYPITKGCFVQSLLEIGPVVVKKIFKICPCIFEISLLSPLAKRPGPSFELTLIPFTNIFCQAWFKIGPVVLEKIFKAHQFFAVLAFGSGELKITLFHCMTYMAMPSKTNPCPWVIKFTIWVYHQCMKLSLFYPCSIVDKNFFTDRNNAYLLLQI